MKPSEISDTSLGASVGILDQALLVGRQVFLGFVMKRPGNRAAAEDVLQEFCIRMPAARAN